jgi:hypothetical protein
MFSVRRAEPRHRIAALDVLGQQLGEHLENLVADLVAERVVDGLEVVDVAHHQAHIGLVGVRIADLPGEVDVEAAAVVERGQRIAHAELLRLGQVPAQLLDLRLRVLEVVLQVGSVTLHLLVLGDQELDHGAHLLGLGERGQMLVRLRQRLGVGVVGVHVGAHEAQDDGELLVELHLGLAQLAGARVLLGGTIGLARLGPVGKRGDAGHAETCQPHQEGGGEDGGKGASARVSHSTLGGPKPEQRNRQSHRTQSPNEKRAHH